MNLEILMQVKWSYVILPWGLMMLAALTAGG